MQPAYSIGLKMLASRNGLDFLNNLAEAVGFAVEADLILIGKLRVSEVDRIGIEAAYSAGSPASLVEYDACGSPCQEIINSGQAKVVPHDLQALYPESPLAAGKIFESYIGLPLIDNQDTLVGVMFAVWRRPLEQRRIDHALNTMNHLAARAGAEIAALGMQRILTSIANGPLSHAIGDFVPASRTEAR